MTEDQHTDERRDTDERITPDSAPHADSHRAQDWPPQDRRAQDLQAQDRPLQDPTSADDPRLDGTYLKRISGTGTRGTVVLVGVTHDHPASTVRARRVVETVAPAVVALELSPLAVPLYRQYAAARDGGDSEPAGEPVATDGGSELRVGDRREEESAEEGKKAEYAADEGRGGYAGGEMAAALAASGDGRVVGIDAPSLAYGQRLAGELRSLDTDRDAAVAAVRDTLSVTKHAIACAVGATAHALTPWSPTVETPATHDSSATDPPAVQAADEARQVSRSRALLGALELPPGQELVDELREASMAARIESLRTEGAVVAVVGHAHLEPIHDRINGE